MHYLQDCLDGEINSELRPYFDGPGGSPGEVDHAQIIEYLGPRADFIAQYYGEKLGAPASVIRLEHEAFFVAAFIDADVIANNIQEYCPAFK